MATSMLFLALLLCHCAHHMHAWSTIPTRTLKTLSMPHHRRSSSVFLPSSSATLLANIGRSWRSTTALFLADTATATPTTATTKEECTDNDVTTKARKPKSGDILTFTLLNFQSTDPNTILEPPPFDTSGTLHLRLNHGNYLPGLHQTLSTMTPGEVIKGCTIDAGYGAYNSQLVFQIDASKLQVDTSLVKVGTMLAMGNGMEVRVTKIEEGENNNEVMWTLDGNHPLAGASYKVDVRLEDVEDAPSQWEYVGDDDGEESSAASTSKYSVATFGLGCFWGGELAYQRVPGVVATAVGYTQGTKVNPSYEEVCTGTTGHTEAIQVVYDPNVVSYRSLVHLAFNRLGEDIYKLNQVGNDRGTQYRHGIYYHDEEQRKVAEELLQSYATADREVFTEVKEAKVFYTAEEYHQQYLLKGGQSAKKGASENIRCYG